MSSLSIDASEHPIKSVTIFSSSKAEVIRNFTVTLQEGHNEVKITSLPSSIDTESARVTGLGDASLFDVVCIISDDKPRSIDGKSDALKELERKKSLLETEKAVKRDEAQMLAQFGYTLHAENNTTSSAEAFLDKFVERARSIVNDSAKLDLEIVEIEKQITEVKHQEAQKRKRAATHGQVSAVIMAKKGGSIQMTLTYMVSGTSWTSSYDLRASTEGGKPPKTVTLHYRAAIVQNTGEDWSNTSLSLSTANPGLFTSVPALRSLRIVPLQGSGLFFKANNAQPAFAPFQAQQQQQQQRAVGLFGQPTMMQPQPQQPQPQQPHTSAFGGTGNAFAPTSGGLFGRSTQPAAAPGGPTGSTQAFGAFGAAPTPGPVFGTTAAASSFAGGPSGPSLFGTNTTAQPAEHNPPEDPGSWTTIDEISGDAAQDTRGTETNSGSWSSTATSVTESAVASSFRIDGLCSIPSDSSSHKVTVAILPFKADVHYVAVPRTTPVAFLQCKVTNTSEYRLLHGPVSVYMDESPVSKTFIPDVNPEETFTCTLGPDPSLRIKLIRLPRTVSSVGSAFAAQTTSATYKHRLTVQNTHTFPVKDFILRDAIPLPSAESGPNTQIKIVLKEPSGLSDAAAGELVDVKKALPGSGSSAKVRWEKLMGDKEGKFEWVLNIDAGEEIKVESEYDVRAPSDFKWTLQESI